MDCSHMDRMINLAAKDTKKGARVVAKIFYRMLQKRGFTESQIINITTHILHCLIEKSKGSEEKQDSSGECEEEAHKKYPLCRAKVRETYPNRRSRYGDAESIQY